MNDDSNRWRAKALPSVGYCAIAVLVVLLGAGPSQAASIPAWLDDAITKWNKENPAVQIRFVEIHDSYVWYTVPSTPEIGHQELRESIYGIVQGNGYERMEAEELVTTGKPPTPTDKYKDKKCWQRGFTLDLDTGSQRVLTTLVCAAEDNWFAGFRILQ